MTAKSMSGLHVMAAKSNSPIAWRYLKFMDVESWCDSAGLVGPSAVSNLVMKDLSEGRGVFG